MEKYYSLKVTTKGSKYDIARALNNYADTINQLTEEDIDTGYEDCGFGFMEIELIED